jgi:hypothetical protein
VGGVGTAYRGTGCVGAELVGALLDGVLALDLCGTGVFVLQFDERPLEVFAATLFGSREVGEVTTEVDLELLPFLVGVLGRVAALGGEIGAALFDFALEQVASLVRVDPFAVTFALEFGFEVEQPAFRLFHLGADAGVEAARRGAVPSDWRRLEVDAAAAAASAASEAPAETAAFAPDGLRGLFHRFGARH